MADERVETLLCPVCGGRERRFVPVLWDGLVEEWGLSVAEREYVDRQQGEVCTTCSANLRSMVLARALLKVMGESEPLQACEAARPRAHERILEVNEAGTLHGELTRFPGHVFAQYPEVDMQDLPYDDEAFDVVVHSDTLEHVADPIAALRECRRVLRPGGAVVFTVPVIVGRPSRSRGGLPPSYHGNPAETGDDFIVHTEFGDDTWTYIVRAGFVSLSVEALEYPSALAWIGRR